MKYNHNTPFTAEATVKAMDGQIHTIQLNLKDQYRIQTKESKRTFALSVVAVATSLSSLLVSNKTAKAIIGGLGGLLTLATTISNYDAIDKVDSEENRMHIESTLKEIAEEQGIAVMPEKHGWDKV